MCGRRLVLMWVLIPTALSPAMLPTQTLRTPPTAGACPGLGGLGDPVAQQDSGLSDWP